MCTLENDDGIQTRIFSLRLLFFRQLIFGHFFHHQPGSAGSDLSLYSSSIPNVPSSNSIMNDFLVVDTYFKRLYSPDSSQPPMSVDEFLDVMTRWKNSPHQREKVCPNIWIIFFSIKIISIILLIGYFWKNRTTASQAIWISSSISWKSIILDSSAIWWIYWTESSSRLHAIGYISDYYWTPKNADQ